MWLVMLVIFCLPYIFFKLTRGICRSSTCLMGKTAIVTGANSGIGYNTVLNLASRGCRVIMADVVDMEESKKKIIEYTNNSNILTKKIDLSSLQSVRDFASDIISTEDKLDILINNAGIGTSKDLITKDGLNTVMQVNYFGHFLLTHLLTDLLKKSSPSRIIFTSSFMAFYNNLTPANLNQVDKSGSFISRTFAYNNSKHAVLLASDIFSKRLKNFGITSNSVNPGFTATKMLSEFCTIQKITFVHLFTRVLEFIYAKCPWEGSQVLVHVATSRKLENVTGKYFWDCKPFLKPWGANDEQFCEAIWRESEKFVGLKPEEMLQ